MASTLDNTSSIDHKHGVDEKEHSSPTKLDTLDEELRDEYALPGTVAHADDDERIKLSWRTWIAIFFICFATFAQIYVVVSSVSVIGFIIRDLGRPDIAGWLIQAPLLMQAVLSPIMGRLSDLTSARWVSGVPPFLAVVGAAIAARANSMEMLIGGSVLIGFSLGTVAIVLAIPSEVLPLRYRAVANGLCFVGGSSAGIIGGLSAGALIRNNPGGWRTIYWIQVAFHLINGIGILVFFNPKPNPIFKTMSLKQLIWATDPIGSLLFAAGSTLVLVALNWSGGTYPWASAHVLGTLIPGIVVLILFGIYEWKGRKDGIVAHVFFDLNKNFMWATLAFSIEGWIFFSAVNQYTPQIVLNLGFEDDSWSIGIRQLSFSLTSFFACYPIVTYSTWRKDIKTPLIFTFTVFLAVCCAYGNIKPSWNKAQLALNVLAGIGQAGPLILLVVLVQFSAPHAYLSGATGLAFSGRAIGGAFGSAVLGTIVNGKLESYPTRVGADLVAAGLPESSVATFLTDLAAGKIAELATLPGSSAAIVAAGINASHEAYAYAYRFAWLAIVPFVVAAIVCVALTKDVSDQMTLHTEKALEKEADTHAVP